MSNPNAPDRFLTWRWPQDPPEDDPEYGEFDYSDPAIPKRLSYTKDSKKPNTDHTIGNLMRIQLLRDPMVRYSGYRMPHPLIFDTHIRVETQDAKVTPIQAFESALEDLKLETDILRDKFKD
eukprot:gene25431-30708_t